jgi:hypothetical protein
MRKNQTLMNKAQMALVSGGRRFLTSRPFAQIEPVPGLSVVPTHRKDVYPVTPGNLF